MKLALLVKQLPNEVMQCQLCPNFCTIEQDQLGKCNARKNIKSKIYSLTYAKLVAINVDPIEKKPLYHFLPGSKTLSIGTAGCNLHCKWCQNWRISQRAPEGELELSPQEVVDSALRMNCESIAYTYTEPTIFYEYVLNVAKLAHKNKLKNILVTNGYINPAPLKKLIKYIDAANVDIKSMSDEFYKKYCSARLQPVLDTAEYLNKKIHLEITNLLIPTLNDKLAQIKKLAQFVKELDPEIPLHFSAYYPSYKLKIPATPAETVKRARKIALAEGLKHVFTGNIRDIEGSHSYCSACSEVVIERSGYSVKNFLKKGKCECGEEISGEC